ncbi:MAG TPA: SsrA-binding protein SmpB [Patescibacteria group bacterium]|nr:SsrA-binding protein SmpB [Patescibacteria group bacterium]
MAKHKPNQSKLIQNRRARHDYALGDELVVGVALSGAETKALRRGHGHLRGSYVQIKDGELWLFNATITGDAGIKIEAEQQTRNRKLLAKRREIEALAAAKQQGQTIVPLALLTQGRYIKVRIAAGRGKKKYDKRQAIKKRDTERLDQLKLKTRP